MRSGVADLFLRRLRNSWQPQRTANASRSRPKKVLAMAISLPGIVDEGANGGAGGVLLSTVGRNGGAGG